jgi:hypothetical protein
LGFNFTIVIALALYACALAVYRKMRDAVAHVVTAPVDHKEALVNSGPYDAPWQPAATVRSSRSQG